MRKIGFISLLAIAAASALAFSSEAARTSVAGDYVEVRTASVFAGACHYNGELMTTGREAVLAWQINSGAWQGTDLAGVRVLAVVSADANLADAQAARRAEVVVDSAATEAQASAVRAGERLQRIANAPNANAAPEAAVLADELGRLEHVLGR